MSEDVIRLCQLVLLEIESMQNRINILIGIAATLNDRTISSTLHSLNDQFNAARVTLLDRLRTVRSGGD